MSARGQRVEKSAASLGAAKTAAAVVGAIVLAGVAWRMLRPTPVPEAQAPISGSAAVADAGPALAAVRAADPVKAIRGRWLRPDGGYILELKEVRADGQAAAEYFNPAPIHVSRAEVKPDGSRAVAMIELRDVNYPGCIYRLTYNPETDELSGDYFQAALEQTFDVVFVRADR